MNPQKQNPSDSLNFHKCNSCAYRTKFLRIIHYHIRRHPKDPFYCEQNQLEEFECQFCDFQHDLKLALDRHNTLVHGKVDCSDPEVEVRCYKCEKCDFETYSLLVFAGHRCDTKRFERDQRPSEPGSKRYINTENVRWFECDHCPYKSKYRLALERHTMTKHASAEMKKWLTCDQCSYKTLRTDSLKSHITYKHTSSDAVKWFECEQCWYRTKAKHKLRRHFTGKHAKPEECQWFECDQCPFRAKANSNLRAHFRVRHAGAADVSWFECDQCNYKTRTKSCFRVHFTAKHAKPEDVERFECYHCPYKALRKSQLIDHITLMHSSPDTITWFECDQCSFKTTTKRYLRIHLNGRHGNRRDLRKRSKVENKESLSSKWKVSKWFECKQCSYKTVHKYWLKSHIKCRHGGSGQVEYVQSAKDRRLSVRRISSKLSDDSDWFQCDQCAYKTKSERGLKVHVLFRHTYSDRWFECDRCSYTMKLKGLLNTHILKVHRKIQN